MASTIMHLTMYSPLQQCWHTIHRMSVWNLASRRLLCTSYAVPGPKTRVQMVFETRKNKSSMIADCQQHVYFRESSSHVDGDMKERQLVDGRGESSSHVEGDMKERQLVDRRGENSSHVDGDMKERQLVDGRGENSSHVDGDRKQRQLVDGRGESSVLAHGDIFTNQQHADCQQHVYFRESSSHVDGDRKQRQLVDGRGESSVLAHGDIFTNQQHADCQQHVYFRESSSHVDGDMKERQLVDGRGESSVLAHGDIFTNQQLKSWLENMEHLRKELNLTKDEFLKLVEDAPRLRHTEQLVHLLNVVAIMKDVGYSDLIAKYFVCTSLLLLLNVTLESLNSVLKDQRDFLLKSEKHDHIFKPIRLSTNGHIEERELFRMSMEPPFTQQKKREYYLEKVLFPRKKLMVDNMPYQSFGEYVSIRLGVEQRVVDSILCRKLANPRLDESLDIPIWTQVYNAVELISVLLDLGASKQDILENHQFLTLDRLSPVRNFSGVYNVVREQKNLFGKVDLKQTKKYLFGPMETDSIRKTLGKLLETSLRKNYVPINQKLYLEDKSQVNAVRVFHLLTDEGFTRQELRKFIYLFGVEESKIRSYLEARKGTGDKTSLKELEDAMKKGDNQVTKLFYF